MVGVASTRGTAGRGTGRRPRWAAICYSLQASAEHDPSVCGVGERDVLDEATWTILGACVVPSPSPILAPEKVIPTESNKAGPGRGRHQFSGVTAGGYRSDRQMTRWSPGPQGPGAAVVDGRINGLARDPSFPVTIRT